MQKHLLILLILFLSFFSLSAQSTKGSVEWVDDATRDVIVREGYLDEVVLNVGEVINIYADMSGVADSTYEPGMSGCWVDHAWVFTTSGGTDNDYILINHTNSREGLSTVMGLKVCKRVMFEIYYSVTWTYPGDNTKYVAQSHYYFYVTVKDVKVNSISLPETVQIKVGQYKILPLKITPSDANPKLIWSSSDDKVARVNQSGQVYGVSDGLANITVITQDGKSSSCLVTVCPKPEGISFRETNLYISQGYGLNLIPVVTPSHALTDFKWKSSDSSIATVSSDGYVTGIRPGNAKITCTTENSLSAECVVNVSHSKEGFSINTIMGKFSHTESILKKSINLLEKSNNE